MITFYGSNKKCVCSVIFSKSLEFVEIVENFDRAFGVALKYESDINPEIFIQILPKKFLAIMRLCYVVLP